MRSAARGMTLIEMAVASAILGVVLVAIGSVMVMAARMTSSPASAEVRTNAVSSAIGVIASDLSRATGVLSADARSIRFTATDRGGDGVDDEITISWDGEKLSDLTRRVNSDPPVTLAESVEDFSLSYVAGSVAATSTGPSAEGAEEVMYVDDAPTNGTPFQLNAGAWASLVITPELPTDATAWRLTRARVSLRSWGTTLGTVAVSVIGVSLSPFNFGATLATASRAESEFATSFGWHEFAWPSMATLAPGQSVAIRIRRRSSSRVSLCRMRVRTPARWNSREPLSPIPARTCPRSPARV
jgi:prepilin-type N-terminal cleavage/methylation domain-containing protein